MYKVLKKKLPRYIFSEKKINEVTWKLYFTPLPRMPREWIFTKFGIHVPKLSKIAERKRNVKGRASLSYNSTLK